MQQMVFFLCQTICSTPWEGRSFQNRQLGALLTVKPAGPPRPGRRRVADRACAGLVRERWSGAPGLRWAQIACQTPW